MFPPTFKITSNLNHPRYYYRSDDFFSPFPFDLVFFWYAAFFAKSAFDNELHDHFLTHFLTHSPEVSLCVPLQVS
jgi:hypothetical protein